MHVCDRAELIKWWDAIDLLACRRRPDGFHFGQGLSLARTCSHPDAQWLALLFPEGVRKTRDQVWEILVAQGEDARALFFASLLESSNERLQRAAELGYAPAQAFFGRVANRDRCFVWAQKAAAQGDRNGLALLAGCLEEGRGGCARDQRRALAAWREAAELGHAGAMHALAMGGFGEEEPERFAWLGRALTRATPDAAALTGLRQGAAAHWKHFGSARSNRALCAVGAACRGHLDRVDECAFGIKIDAGALRLLQRAVALSEEARGKARVAVECWLGVARRLGMARDMRQLIARLAWRDRWMWVTTASA